MSVTMKVLIAACGNHDARVLSGEGVRRPENGDKGEIHWRGGEIIVVTEDLAAKYEASGQAERVSEKRETATIGEFSETRTLAPEEIVKIFRVKPEEIGTAPRRKGNR